MVSMKVGQSGRSIIDALAPTSRKDFFESYASEPAAAGFTSFLFGQPVEIPAEPDFSNVHIASLAIFGAFQTGDDSLFRTVYNELSRRKLRPDAPWWLNDPLMFGLVLCAVRFGGETSWLRNTLNFRAEHSTGESHKTALTFTDILSENWGSEINIRPLILLAQYLLCSETIASSLLNSAYQMVTEETFPYYESNFLNSVCLRAFDIVILLKAPESPDRTRAIERMIYTALKRSRTRGWTVWWIILLCIVGLFAWLILWVKGLGDGSVKQWIETFSLIGIPIVAVLPIWPWVSNRKRMVNKLQRFFAKRCFGLDMEVLCYKKSEPVVFSLSKHNRANSADAKSSAAD